MPFYVYAWVATVAFGFEAIIAKLITKHAIKNPWLFNFFGFLLISLFTIPVSLISGVGLPREWGSILLVSVLYAFSNITYTFMFYKFDVSVMGPVYNLRIPFTVLFAIPLLGEVLTLNQYILILVMFIGGIVVTIDEKISIKSFFRPVILFALIAVLVNALWGIFVKRVTLENGYWETTLFMMLFAQIFNFVTWPLFKKDIAKINIKQIGALSLMAMVGMIGTVAATRAYTGNASISSVILSVPLSMILAFGFSVFAPKLLEKHTRKIYLLRFAAAAVMVLVGLRLSG